MKERRNSTLPEKQLEEIRLAYDKGHTIPNIIREMEELKSLYPLDLMFVFMDAFGLRLSDVSCIDGWWPPDEKAEISDERLDLFIRLEIENKRHTKIQD